VIKPAFDALVKGALADLALANGDGLTAQLLSESGVDTARNQDWAGALARYAIAARPGNRAVVDSWVDKWRPAADGAVAGLAEIFAEAPVPASPESAVATVAESVRNFKEEIDR
jgi:toluene monooxygenase system protein E